MTEWQAIEHPFWELRSDKDPVEILYQRARTVTLSDLARSTTHQHELALPPDYSDGTRRLINARDVFSMRLNVLFKGTDEFDLQSIEFIPVIASGDNTNKVYTSVYTIVRITVIVHDSLISQRFFEAQEAQKAKTKA